MTWGKKTILADVPLSGLAFQGCERRGGAARVVMRRDEPLQQGSGRIGRWEDTAEENPYITQPPRCILVPARTVRSQITRTPLPLSWNCSGGPCTRLRNFGCGESKRNIYLFSVCPFLIPSLPRPRIGEQAQDCFTEAGWHIYHTCRKASVIYSFPINSARACRKYPLW